MRLVSSFSLLVLLAAPIGCHEPARAHAVAEPGSAHAEVRSNGDGNAYDAAKLSRTAVTIAPELASTCRVDGAETFFAFDSTAITDRTGLALRQVAKCVRDGKLAGQEIVLIGHADPRGDDEYNKQLGTSRAESVAGYLREQGVARTQIEINSVGETGASPDTEEWPLDRRVEIRVKPLRAASR